MKEYNLPLSLNELTEINDLLEYEIESLNNALYDNRLNDQASINKRDILRDIQCSVTTAIDFLTE